MCNKIYFKNKLTFSEPRDFPIEEVENSFQPKGVISSLDDRTFPGFLVWNRNISLQSNHPYQHLKNSNDSYFNTNCRDISCTARSSELSCLFLFLIFCLFVFLETLVWPDFLQNMLVKTTDGQLMLRHQVQRSSTGEFIISY